MVPKTNAYVFLEVLEVIFLWFFFGQVWGNLGKKHLHPQKCACLYTYCIYTSWNLLGQVASLSRLSLIHKPCHKVASQTEANLIAYSKKYFHAYLVAFSKQFFGLDYLSGAQLINLPTKITQFYFV